MTSMKIIFFLFFGKEIGYNLNMGVPTQKLKKWQFLWNTRTLSAKSRSRLTDQTIDDMCFEKSYFLKKHLYKLIFGEINTYIFLTGILFLTIQWVIKSKSTHGQTKMGKKLQGISFFFSFLTRNQKTKKNAMRSMHIPLCIA